ncbi:hypothetical protein Tco_1079750 [Tanacetum coccineum]|uniref:Uncharacterized protein n=1 Tax=Tanacetum coccineum TaxID=301880 RepID=A0ABQ5HTC0_9ASTR
MFLGREIINLKKPKRRRKKHKKKVSSVKLGRNKDEGTCLRANFQIKVMRLEEVNSLEETEASNVKEWRNRRTGFGDNSIVLIDVVLLSRTLIFWRLKADKRLMSIPGPYKSTSYANQGVLLGLDGWSDTTWES